MKTGVGATFTLSRDEESRLLATSKLSAVIARAVESGHMTGPVRWCPVEISDRKTAEAVLGCVRRKATWVLGDAAALLASRRRSPGRRPATG